MTMSPVLYFGLTFTTLQRSHFISFIFHWDGKAATLLKPSRITSLITTKVWRRSHTESRRGDRVPVGLIWRRCTETRMWGARFLLRQYQSPPSTLHAIILCSEVRDVRKFHSEIQDDLCLHLGYKLITGSPRSTVNFAQWSAHLLWFKSLSVACEPVFLTCITPGQIILVLSTKQWISWFITFSLSQHNIYSGAKQTSPDWELICINSAESCYTVEPGLATICVPSPS